MKKLNTMILALSALAASTFLVSCLNGDGTNKYYGSGVFTVEKTAMGYNLYSDGAGMVRPTLQSVTDLVGAAGFQNGQRVVLDYTYTDDNFKEEPGKGSYIDNVELYQGQQIPKVNILTKEEAESKNLLDPDSIFSIGSEISIWAYRGYLTTQHKGRFSVVSDKGIYPTLNIVYDKDENGAPNNIRLKMYYNQHTAKNAQSTTQTFFTSYPLSMFTSLIPGNDSVTFSIDGLGLSKTFQMKVGREDLTPGNYIYYNLGYLTKK